MRKIVIIVSLTIFMAAAAFAADTQNVVTGQQTSADKPGDDDKVVHLRSKAGKEGKVTTEEVIFRIVRKEFVLTVSVLNTVGGANVSRNKENGEILLIPGQKIYLVWTFKSRLDSDYITPWESSFDGPVTDVFANSETKIGDRIVNLYADGKFSSADIKIPAKGSTAIQALAEVK